MTTRDISAANISALEGSVVRPILFVRLDFDVTVRRFHTEIGPRTATHPDHGAEVYTGVGDFGGIVGDVTESIGSAPLEVRIALSGINSALITESLGDDYHLRDVDIMLGLDNASGSLVADPVILWGGYMDKPGFTFEKGKADLIMTCESKATRLQETPDLRFTDEQLQAEYSGDLAAEYVFRMPDIILEWGGTEGNNATPRTGWASG
jgi:hypothetical protein